jgi:hypothetical protein
MRKSFVAADQGGFTNSFSIDQRLTLGWAVYGLLLDSLKILTLK